MIKVFVSNAMVSPGYENGAAIKESESGNAIQFRIGSKVYDPNAEDKTRWVNITVKAFGKTCERVKNMKLQEKSSINVSGRLDEESWTTKDNEKKSRFVIIADEIEFGYGGAGKQTDKRDASASAVPEYGAHESEPDAAPQQTGFTGYENFGSGNRFFDPQG